MRLDKRHIWKEKFADSKVPGYVWTGPNAFKNTTTLLIFKIVVRVLISF